MALTKEKRIYLFAEAPIPKAIVTLAVPTLLSQLITMIYNLADSFFVGRLGDPYQVAALSLVFPLFMITTMIANLFGIGANGVISRSLGAAEYEQAKAASAFAFFGAAVAAVLVSVICAVFLTPMLEVAGASEMTLGYARDYLKFVLVFGGLPTILELTLSHLIRAEGNSRQAGFGIMLGGVLNIFLDPIFIFRLKMGVSGAAAATLISNIVSLVFFFAVIIRTRKESFLSFRPGDIRPGTALDVLKNGLPSSMQIVFGSTGNIVMTHTAAGFSDMAVASFGILQKFTTMAVHIAVGVSQGVMPLLGFNYTARNYSRIRSINRTIIIGDAAFSAVFLAVVELFPRAFVSLFIANPDSISMVVTFVRIGFIGVVGTVLMNYFIVAFQAFGKWKICLFLTFMRQILIYVPAILIMSRLWGVYGLAGSFTAAELTSCVIIAVFFLHLMKRVQIEICGE